MRALLLLLIGCDGALKGDSGLGDDTGEPVGADDTGAPDDADDSGDPVDTGDSAEPTEPPGELEDGFEADLTGSEGCGDAFLAAFDASGTILLEFYAEGLVRAAYEAGETSGEATWALPHPDVRLAVQTGQDSLDRVSCTDDRPDVELYRRYEAVGGTATLSFVTTSETWSGGEVPADAVLLLEDAVFEDPETGDQVTVPLLTVSSDVGWWAG